MIELLPETGSGTITEEDFDRYFAEADAIFNRERVEHLVFDWEHLDGRRAPAPSARGSACITARWSGVSPSLRMRSGPTRLCGSVRNGGRSGSCKP